MQIIHDITMDMARRLPVVPIHAVQGDGSTRLLRLTLLQNGESWPLPQNTTAAVAFRKSDGTRGLYDTLPSGETAVTFTGNTVTAVLAPQALSCPGAVSAAVVFYDANRNALATFPFQIAVARNPAAGEQLSNNYYYLQNMEQVNTAYNELLNRTNAIFGGYEAKNYVAGIPVYGGYLGHDGTLQPYEWANYATVYTEKFAVTPGDVLSITYKQPLEETGKGSLMWRGYGLYDAEGNWLRRAPAGAVEGIEQGGYYIYTEEIAVANDVGYLCVMCRSNIFAQGTVTDLWGETATPPQDVLDNVFTVFSKGELAYLEANNRFLPAVSDADNGKVATVANGRWVVKVPEDYSNPNVKAVNHRGYNTAAPENTLSAFRLSRKMGFQYAECDVAFTADGIAVLLHDTTVDRTSNGTGNIADMTFDEVRALDFGSWKSADYAGEQIPFLEEFLILCKQIGLHPYIEVKSETVPEANIADIVAAVNRCGMKNKVTYISFSPWYLTKIKELDGTARLGLVVNDVTQTTITQATSLKTDKNEVFIDAGYWALTLDAVELCAASGIPLEVWTINGSADLLALDPYVSGYTSDNLRANVTLYDDSGM